MPLDYKSILLSRTFWGVVLNVIFKLVAMVWAVEVDEETVSMTADLTVSLMTFALSFLFDLMAIYGRIKAKTRIGRKGGSLQ